MPSDLAILTTLDDVKSFIFEQVKRARRIDYKHRHDYEDLVSEAVVGFMEAYNSFDPRKGTIGRRASFLAWYRLLHYLQTEPPVPIELKEEVLGSSRDKPFWLVDLLDELSEDARFVVELVLDMPEDLALIMCEEDLAPITVIKYYLIGGGWSGSKIASVFKEVREALELG